MRQGFGTGNNKITAEFCFISNKLLTYNRSLTLFIFTAVCQKFCQNGGKCIGPNKCQCQPGYSGQWCEICKYLQVIYQRRNIPIDS